MQIYIRKELSENSYEVLGSDGTVLMNHKGKSFLNLSENISRNLISDLNYIATKYYQLPEGDEDIEELMYNHVLATISGEELRQSFEYEIRLSIPMNLF
jgi:hypothetical protein